MRTSESIEQVSAAVVAFQAEMESVAKGADNPFFHSRYADLPGITEAIKPIAAKHKIAVIQSIEETDGLLNCINRIVHESGEWIEGVVPVRVEKLTPQGYGSAITYARRYGLQAILGLSAADDDVNGAEKPQQKPKPQSKRTSAKPASQPPQDNEGSRDTLAQIDFIKQVAYNLALGDDDQAYAILHDWSKFIGAKDKKEHSLKDWDQLEKATPKWIASVYNKAKAANEKMPEPIEEDNLPF